MRGRAMSAAGATAAGSEATYGGGVENGTQQQASPNAILLSNNGVARSNHRGYPRPAAGNNAAALAAARISSAGATASSERGKRKRRRPCKYDDPPEPEPLPIVPPAQTVAAAGGTSAANGSVAALTFPPGFSPTCAGASHQVPPPPLPAALDAPQRWLPVTSAKLQPTSAEPGTGGVFSLKPFVFTVQAGEDIASRTMSFCCNGWAVCILQANGIVSNVTLRQDSSRGTVSYELHWPDVKKEIENCNMMGLFKILSLAGSYTLSNSSGLSSRIGGLIVSLAGPDGRLFGGSVNGPFIAASPVQVLIGSFLSDGRNVPDPNFLPGRLLYIPSAPPSGGILSESSGGHGSPPNIATTSNQPGFPNFPPRK